METHRCVRSIEPLAAMRSDHSLENFITVFGQEELSVEDLTLLTDARVSVGCRTLSSDAAALINIIDFDLVPSLPPELFRKVFPSLLYGALHCLRDKSNPIVYSLFSDLINYSDPTFWGQNFQARWLNQTARQYGLVGSCVEALEPMLGEHDTVRALITLDVLASHDS